MAANDIRSCYWEGPRLNTACVAVRAHKISKTAWMDLYYDLYQQTHGDADQETVLADAIERLGILKANGLRK